MRWIVLSLMLWLSGPAVAEPRTYALDRAASSVSFTYVLSGIPGSGTMPVDVADLVIDFADVSRTTARVTLDVTGVRTSAIFVTQALKSKDVLWSAAHPKVEFVSRRVAGSIRDGAVIEGNVTVRGVTRPLTLQAQVYRRAGSAEGDLSRLSVLLTGALDRSAFGATGFSDLVDDRVELRILARLTETTG